MDQSHLGRLSAELRNCIAELALYQEDTLVIVHHTDEESERIGTRTKKKEDSRHLLAYSSTCKQLRNETIPLFYNINNFAIKSGMHIHTFYREPFEFRNSLHQFELQIGQKAFACVRHIQFVKSFTSYDLLSIFTPLEEVEIDMAKTVREWVRVSGLGANEGKPKLTAKFEALSYADVAPDLAFDLEEPIASWEKNIAIAQAGMDSIPRYTDKLAWVLLRTVIRGAYRQYEELEEEEMEQERLRLEEVDQESSS